MAIQTAKRDPNRVTTLLGVDNVTFTDATTVAVNPTTHALVVDATFSAASISINDGVDSGIKATVIDLTDSNPLTVAIVDGSGDQITSFGGGTQYTDGGVPPAHPVGPTLEWSDGANWQTVSTTKPLPVAVISALPAGTNVIGHVIADTGSTTAVTGNVTVVQGTASNLKAQVTGAGTAGTADAGVITIQGIASMTAVQVTEATIDAAIVAQGTALGTIKNLMVAGSVTTNAPTYTTGNINPISLTTAGGVRVDLKDTASNTNNINVNLAASAATVTVSATNLSTNIAQVAGATVQTGNGTAAGSIRVSLASDSTGNIATIGTSVTPGTAAGNLGKAEDAGHSSGDTGVMALGVANTALAAISSTTLDYTPIATNLDGRVIVVIAPPAAMVRGTATTTGTSDTSLVAASGDASLKTYITDIQIANTGATTSLITFKDGSGGSTLGYTIAPAGGGSNIHFDIPLVTTANTAFYFTAASASTTIYGSAQGYKAP